MSRLEQTVALRKTLGEMVTERDNAVRLWNTGYKVLQQSHDLVAETIRYGAPQMYDIASPCKAAKMIDGAYWRASFERTGMTQIMDAKATTEFKNSLEKEPPQFSMDNIEAQYLTMYQDAEHMFQRGIYEVFRYLDHSYWNNNHEPYSLSRKNIIRGLFDTWAIKWSDRDLRLSYYNSDRINDIDRCVKVLTGRRHQPRELESKINQAMKGEAPWIYEDDDYQLKGFKNGNGHLIFKNQDTIDRLNREIANYCNHHQLAEAA